MNFYIIYKLIFPNDKIFIGQTIQEFNIRMNQYKIDAYNESNKNKKYNRLISKKIRQYGWNNIKKEIICTVSEEFVDEAERYFIKRHNSLVVNGQGYNIEDGGNKNKHHSEETKKKLSNANGGKNSYWFGKQHTKEYRIFMKKMQLGKNNSFYGKHHTETVKERIRNGSFGKKQTKEHIQKRIKIKYKSIDVYIKKTDDFIGTFTSVKQIEEKLNLLATCIYAVLNKRRKSAGGYYFRFVS